MGEIYSNFRMLPERKDGEDADIAVCEITSIWGTIVSQKPKGVIDLDTWIQPDWEMIGQCGAAGYPTKGKKHQGQHVVAPMPFVIAGLASNVTPGSPRFTFEAQLASSGQLFCSGMSGGPVYALVSKSDFLPVGIIYAGFPSREDEQKAPDAFYDDHHVIIHAVLLTPERFDSWLVALGILT